MMFDGFKAHTFDVGDDIEIFARVAGSGPGLLLLHGFPQTHVCWHKIAPALAQRFTVVAPDLRGYGASSKPAGSDGHANYSKRAMASDQIEVMRQLGFSKFSVAGHDRGGRVAHRMSLDHPDGVARLAVIDIAPTVTMYAATDRAFAEAYYHWFFLIQPRDFPERMIERDPDHYLRHTLANWCKTEGAITAQAMTAYRDAFCRPEAIHAACEDYRASATIDLTHDAEDDAQNNKINAPLCVVWGERGAVGRLFDPPATWRDKAISPMVCQGLDCGHFVPEECPDELLAALQNFFGD